jgi:hypothetical protein
MKKLNNMGFSAVEALLILVVIGILGFTGWFVYHSQKLATKDYSSQSSIQTSSTKKSTEPSDPYAGWKTYTSSFEKLTFKYPADWRSVTPEVPSTDPSADSFELKSPSNALSISWDSEIDGIGGACDPDVMPGGAAPAGQPSPCPYWTVTDKQKLTGADLYYVAGIVTKDGSTYSPWCALQDAKGILESQSNIGYLLFAGKNNYVSDGAASKGTIQAAGLLCGRPFGGQGLISGTKAQATAALSSAEYRQAKLVLLSATY